MTNIIVDSPARQLALAALAAAEKQNPAGSPDDTLYLVLRDVLNPAKQGAPILAGVSTPCQSLWQGNPLPQPSSLKETAPKIKGCSMLINTTADGDPEASFVELPATLSWTFMDDPEGISQLIAASISFVDTDGVTRRGTLDWDIDSSDYRLTVPADAPSSSIKASQFPVLEVRVSATSTSAQLEYVCDHINNDGIVEGKRGSLEVHPGEMPTEVLISGCGPWALVSPSTKNTFDDSVAFSPFLTAPGVQTRVATVNYTVSGAKHFADFMVGVENGDLHITVFGS